MLFESSAEDVQGKAFPRSICAARWKDWHGLSTVRLTLGFLGLNLIFAWESNVKSVMLPWHSPSSFRTLDTLESRVM